MSRTYCVGQREQFGTAWNACRAVRACWEPLLGRRGKDMVQKRLVNNSTRMMAMRSPRVL
jgi:hypothetical protein